MRIPLTVKGTLALMVWAAFAVCAVRGGEPGSLIPEQVIPISKIKAIVIEGDGTDHNRLMYVDHKDDEIAKLKATIASLNRDIADLKALVNRQTTLPAPTAVAAPLYTGTTVGGTVCVNGQCTTTAVTGPLGRTRATTVCTNDQCFTVPAGYTTSPGVTYNGPAYEVYSVPSGYGFGGSSCGAGVSVSYGGGGWYPGKFLGRVRGGGCP